MLIRNLKHVWGALKNALAGLRRAWQGEYAFRHEVLILGLMVILLALIRPGIIWSAGLLAAWLLVMALELLNSAIEEFFDLVSPEYNLHVKYGKDMAAAAILIGIAINGLLWIAMLVWRFG